MQQQNQAVTLDTIARQQDVLQSAIVPVALLQERNTDSLERLESYMRTLASQQRPLFSQKPLSNAHQEPSHIRFIVKRRKKCEAWCKCLCHRTAHFNTPKLLKGLLGIAYAGYSGVPALTPKCTSKICSHESSATVHLNYLFPSWVLARMVCIVGDFTQDSVELCIRTLRVRPSGDDIFVSAYTGEVETLKRLLANGKASVLDIEVGCGQTALHLSLFRGNFNVTRLLLQAGADAHLENYSQE